MVSPPELLLTVLKYNVTLPLTVVVEPVDVGPSRCSPWQSFTLSEGVVAFLFWF